MSNYAEKYRDPRWQKLRLLVLERDGWCCNLCGNKDETLQVHHRYYEKDKDPWDYPHMACITLCEQCHDSIEETIKWIRDEAPMDCALNQLLKQIRKGQNRAGEMSVILSCIETIAQAEADFAVGYYKAHEKTDT